MWASKNKNRRERNIWVGITRRRWWEERKFWAVKSRKKSTSVSKALWPRIAKTKESLWNLNAIRFSIIFHCFDIYCFNNKLLNTTIYISKIVVVIIFTNKMSFGSVRQDLYFNSTPAFVPRINYTAVPSLSIKKATPRKQQLFSSPKLVTKFAKPHHRVNCHAPIY